MHTYVHTYLHTHARGMHDFTCRLGWLILEPTVQSNAAGANITMTQAASEHFCTWFSYIDI